MTDYTQAKERMEAMVARSGHAIMCVGQNIPCIVCGDGRPHSHGDLHHQTPRLGFSYTVGLCLLKLPELILFGDEHVVAGAFLNRLAAMMKERGRAYQHKEWVDTGGKFPILAVQADKPETWTDYVVWPWRVFGLTDYPVIQFIAADKQGRLPPDCDPPYSLAPILSSDLLPPPVLNEGTV